ncbi:cobaltochelatase CobT-related protein [Trinickia dinghuensis]|uniref:Cobalamin biosynthesis protein CobT n=1 Tax=Trinickia dinghuensis TaxID=2291023 RepID=A0A3D8K6T7_9BURK|nr:cobalamin biosynthesis protein CobT [Trinickia dinghuensis]RDV00607.1 cobalamin biosynthesis protein CobT [Trinickia dinghuensis]
MSEVPIEPGDDTLAYLSRLARALTGRDRLEVVIADDGDDPHLSEDRFVLPEIASGADASIRIMTMTGYVDLLAARARFSDYDALDRLHASAARRLAQAIEDRRACERLMEIFPGAASFLSHSRVQTARAMSVRWTKLSWAEKLTWRVERFLWNETPTATESSRSLDAALGASGDLLDRARMTASTGDSIRIAIDLVQRIRGLSAGNVNNMMFTAGPQSTLDAAVIESEMAFDDPGAAEDPSTSNAAASSSGGTPAQTQAESDATDQPAGEASAHPSASFLGSRPTLSVPITTQFDVETDLTGKGDPVGWRKLRSAARAQTESLKAKLERALKADEQTHWKREQERGELDRPSLARLATSPGYRTPFRTKRVRPGRDAAVTLLIDRSGSMAGNKIELAKLCAAALSDALSRLDFPFEVLGYSSIEDEAMREYHQRWLANGNTPRGYNRFVERLDLQIYKRFDSDNLSGLACVECGHENPDGEALSWASARLLARRAHRHILMVLSDGYPATGDGHPAVLRTDLHLRVDELLERGVELVGVGVLADAVRDFYPTSIVVEQLHDLPRAAFDVLGQTLLKHREWMLETPRA